MSSQKTIESTTPNLPTPYYLIDEQAIVNNLTTIKRICDLSGAKALLALKCFATWGVFDAMKPYLHGTTSSSLNEVRLGAEKFGGETHAYSVAYAEHEIYDVVSHADKIIFNSFSQLNAFRHVADDKGIPIGLRVNPKTSNSSFIIADPARPFSRLGEHDVDKIMSVIDDISGIMIHNNCENDDFHAFCASLDDIENKFSDMLPCLDWVSLGGGIHYIAQDYPVEAFAKRLKQFSDDFGVQVYLEPGEASIHNGALLVTSVLDTMHNGKPLAVVDASIEAHMLDLLIYRESASLVGINDQSINLFPISQLQDNNDGINNDGINNDDTNVSDNKTNDSNTIIYGKSCLAGDIFGEYALNDIELKTGDKVAFGNAAGYTMVKKNWFNGVAMPAIVIKRLNGQIETQRQFTYEDFKSSLS